LTMQRRGVGGEVDAGAGAGCRMWWDVLSWWGRIVCGTVDIEIGMHVCFYQRRALCISAWMDASVRAVDMCEDDLFIQMHPHACAWRSRQKDRQQQRAAFLPRAKRELGLNLDSTSLCACTVFQANMLAVAKRVVGAGAAKVSSLLTSVGRGREQGKGTREGRESPQIRAILMFPPPTVDCHHPSTITTHNPSSSLPTMQHRQTSRLSHSLRLQT
jgi:hypothetical protein